ncbi:hypothetical protein [Halochromatium salexigens]|uniref:hypothetical protein n=1 Tax=Halochromatium salexigens TaxID=49447 RepID=UPI003B8317FF
MEVNWLRERFDLQGKYSNIRDFKARILKPAVEQINAHSDLWVNWEQQKRGRVVHALTFRFGLKAASVAELQSKPSPKRKLTRAYVESHARPGETWEQAEERLRRTHQA